MRSDCASRANQDFAQIVRPIKKRNEEAFWTQYELDGASSISGKQWMDWVNDLPVALFMVMVDVHRNAA